MSERFKAGDIIQWIRSSGSKCDELLVLSDENILYPDRYCALNLVESEVQDDCWWHEEQQGRWVKLA